MSFFLQLFLSFYNEYLIDLHLCQTLSVFFCVCLAVSVCPSSVDHFSLSLYIYHFIVHVKKNYINIWNNILFFTGLHIDNLFFNFMSKLYATWNKASVKIHFVFFAPFYPLWCFVWGFFLLVLSCLDDFLERVVSIGHPDTLLYISLSNVSKDNLFLLLNTRYVC